MYPTACKIASRKLLYSTGNSSPCSVNNLDGWGTGGRKGGSRGMGDVYIRLIHEVVQLKLTEHCKAIIIQ